MDFIQAQMQAVTEQAKDLSQTATKAMTDTRENPDKARPIVLIARRVDLPRFRGEVRSWDQGIWFDGILSSSFE